MSSAPSVRVDGQTATSADAMQQIPAAVQASQMQQGLMNDALAKVQEVVASRSQVDAQTQTDRPQVRVNLLFDAANPSAVAQSRLQANAASSSAVRLSSGRVTPVQNKDLPAGVPSERDVVKLVRSPIPTRQEPSESYRVTHPEFFETSTQQLQRNRIPQQLPDSRRVFEHEFNEEPVDAPRASNHVSPNSGRVLNSSLNEEPDMWAQRVDARRRPANESLAPFATDGQPAPATERRYYKAAQPITRHTGEVGRAIQGVNDPGARIPGVPHFPRNAGQYKSDAADLLQQRPSTAPAAPVKKRTEKHPSVSSWHPGWSDPIVQRERDVPDTRRVVEPKLNLEPQKSRPSKTTNSNSERVIYPEKDREVNKREQHLAAKSKSAAPSTTPFGTDAQKATAETHRRMSKPASPSTKTGEVQLAVEGGSDKNPRFGKGVPRIPRDAARAKSNIDQVLQNAFTGEAAPAPRPRRAGVVNPNQPKDAASRPRREHAVRIDFRPEELPSKKETRELLADSVKPKEPKSLFGRTKIKPYSAFATDETFKKTFVSRDSFVAAFPEREAPLNRHKLSNYKEDKFADISDKTLKASREGREKTKKELEKRKAKAEAAQLDKKNFKLKEYLKRPIPVAGGAKVLDQLPPEKTPSHAGDREESKRSSSKARSESPTPPPAFNLPSPPANAGSITPNVPRPPRREAPADLQAMLNDQTAASAPAAPQRSPTPASGTSTPNVQRKSRIVVPEGAMTPDRLRGKTTPPAAAQQQAQKSDAAAQPAVADQQSASDASTQERASPNFVFHDENDGATVDSTSSPAADAQADPMRPRRLTVQPSSSSTNNDGSHVDPHAANAPPAVLSSR